MMRQPGWNHVARHDWHSRHNPKGIDRPLVVTTGTSVI
jgi:hypothetical protein